MDRSQSFMTHYMGINIYDQLSDSSKASWHCCDLPMAEGGGDVGQQAEYLGGGWRFLAGLSRAMLPVSLPLFLPALAPALP
jgi:hypothetical protein